MTAECNHEPQRNLRALWKDELLQWLIQHGEPPYRARQILRWIWLHPNQPIEQWTDLPKSLRKALREEFTLQSLQAIEHARAPDYTEKWVFQAPDGTEFETVLIPDKAQKHHTLCVSTQSGCPIKCTFCATGLMGLIRNLHFWEIVDQVAQVQQIKKIRIDRIVLMGMGEPLINLKEVLKAIELWTDKHLFRIGARHITVSTVGIPRRIDQLAEATQARVRLALSLHSAIQEKREQLVPLARIYPLEILVPHLQAYQKQHKRWLTFEYVLLPGVNMSKEDIEALVELGMQVPAKVNLIPWNAVLGLPYRVPEPAEVYAFARRLEKLYPYPVIVRRPRGRAIQAACGQLVRMHVSANKTSEQFSAHSTESADSVR